MYEFKFKDDTKDEEKKSNKQKLMDIIKGVDETFQLSEKPTKPEDLTLDRREYKEVNQQKIKDEATDSLKSFLADGLNKINDEYATTKNKLDNEITSAKFDGEAKVKALEDSYSTKETRAVNSAINRGVNRGSVLTEQVSDIRDAGAQDIDEARGEIQNKINSLNSQKELLETKKKNALDAFDIAYAVKLNEKIGKINEDLTTYNQKAQAYNDAQEKREKDFNIKNETEYQKNLDRVMDRNQKLLDFISRQGRDGLESRMALKKSEMALDFLDEMRPQDAIAMLVGDDDIANALGETAYQAVLKAMTERLRQKSGD